MKHVRRAPQSMSGAGIEWGGRLPVALVFPQSAALAYSSLGWQAVYRLLRDNQAVVVEPVFWDPGRDRIVRTGNGRGLNAFGLAAFSLTYEFDYLHLFRLLLAAGIEPVASRRPSWPLVMAGGALASLNPAPIAPSVDLFWVGEAEAGLVACIERLAEIYVHNGSKGQALEATARMPGVFAPGASVTPVQRAVDLRLQNSSGVLPGPAVSCFTSPDAVFRNSFLLEVNRGCPHGCRFCAAGYIYRPHRQASMEALQKAILGAGPRKVGLVGTALTDWPDLLQFLEWLGRHKLDVSLSSLRAEGLSPELLDSLRTMGVRTVTLALEGASAGLRDSMNKHLSEEAFLRAVERLAARGFNHLKVYLLAGWPGETDQDWQELERLLREADRARQSGKSTNRRGLELITISLGCVVPKPWTPLQWAPMATEQDIKSRISQVRRMAKTFSGIQVSSDSPGLARVQGLLARGDSRTHDLIRLAAAQSGGKMHAWSAALEQWSGDPAWYLDRERDKDEDLAWEVIATGVNRGHLWSEWEKVKARRTSPPCPESGPGHGQAACLKCRRCGLDTLLAGQ